MNKLDFLPINKEDMQLRGWDECDIIVVSGDAYVDHPSFGTAIISRVLERAGYRVCVLAQPDWHTPADFTRFGRPRLGFFVGAGVVDSMVNHYTAAKKPRGEDVYSAGGKIGNRPDRAIIVYCNLIRQAYKKIPIIIGSLEASLRRFAHYDYWDDKVRASILADSGADLLLYGMCENSVVEAAKALENDSRNYSGIRGACYISNEIPEGYVRLPSYNEVRDDKRKYARAYLVQQEEQDYVRGRPLAQFHEKYTIQTSYNTPEKNGGKWVCQTPPAAPLERRELDRVYALPYMRAWHPVYDADGGVPALAEVEFSISATRGCYGSCAFCALTYHQGRVVSSRSPASIVNEAKLLTHLPGFKGYIHDVGGPTANFREPACELQKERGACPKRMCLYPKPCKNLRVNNGELVSILRQIRTLPGVKRVFIRSGIRYDALLLDENNDFITELVKHHVSGQLKVAPEHADARTLDCMGKPSVEVFDSFRNKYNQLNKQYGMNQYIVPYFISSHPGCDLNAAIKLAEYLRDTRLQPEQVQDFYPTPGTLSTCMFHTGIDPRTMKPVYIPKTAREKAWQRALLQYKRPRNAKLVREALRAAGREDLIGFGGRCLVKPERAKPLNP
jgi:uncharacterized radical SAM protein YgiQ